MLLQTKIAFICRTEMEKTPKIVFDHEIAALKSIHGAQRIEVSEDPSPLPAQEVDLDSEYIRIQTEYEGSIDKDTGFNPVLEVFPDFEAFELFVESGPVSKIARKKKAE